MLPVIRFFLLTIFLTPLLGAYKNFGYEQIKVLFFILSISLIGFLWIFREPKLEWNLIRLASFFFILTLFVSSMMGIDPKNSLLGKDPYFQGWIVYAYLGLLALMVSSLNIKLEYFALSLTSSGLIVSVLAIEDWVLKNNLGFLVPTYADRVVSTFGQPNFYSGFLLLNLPFSYLLFKSINKKLSYLGIFGGLISIVGIFVSYSRSTILMALGLLVLALFSSLSSTKGRSIKLLVWIPTLVGMTILVIAVYLSIHFSSGLFWKEFSKPLETINPDLTKEGVEKRAYIWPQLLKIGLERPLLGYGLENINKAFFNYFEKYKHPIFEENLNIQPVLISLKELNIDRTHNYLLDLMLFSGILGVLGYLGLLVVLFKKLLEQKNMLLLVSLITYLIWIQFQNQSIVHLIYFWLLVGLIDSDSKTLGT